MSEAAHELLLNLNLSDAEIHRLLEPMGFSDWQKARRSLERMAAQPPEARGILAEALPQLLLALSEAPDPNQVLVNIERLAQNYEDRIDLFRDFAHNPRTIEVLVSLFSGSRFLTEILLRHPHYFARLTAHHRLAEQKNAQQLAAEAEAVLKPLLANQDHHNVDSLPILDALRQFQRWELLRIGMADLLGSFDLTTVTSQLSFLADSLISAGLSAAAQQTETALDDFIVVALGKLGGKELNYSSDIDLLFLCKTNGDGYRSLGQGLIDILARTTAEGFLYRVDMRLRPWGRSGALVSTLEGYLNYLEKHAGLWEKQALLKARVVAGSLTLGQQFLTAIQPIIYDVTPEAVRDAVSATKQRIEGQLRKRGQQWGEVKLGQGSIRDIEFVTQYLQLVNGGQQPDIRTANTLNALTSLSSTTLLSPEAYRILTDGYIFLRTVEHHLQLMHYQQTHKLPTEAKALNHLARRLGFQGSQAGTNFIQSL